MRCPSSVPCDTRSGSVSITTNCTSSIASCRATSLPTLPNPQTMKWSESPASLPSIRRLRRKFARNCSSTNDRTISVKMYSTTPTPASMKTMLKTRLAVERGRTSSYPTVVIVTTTMYAASMAVHPSTMKYHRKPEPTTSKRAMAPRTLWFFKNISSVLAAFRANRPPRKIGGGFTMPRGFRILTGLWRGLER